jgi:hypothetical protein
MVAVKPHNEPAAQATIREIMLPESAFSIVSIAAIAAWLGLAIATLLRAGRARDTILFFSGRVAPLLLCAAYVMFLAQYWGSTPGGGFRSLEAVQILFAAPGKMLGAWTLFLTFDLFVGRWLVDDASSRGNSRLPLLLALPATFFFGPFGLLLYLAGQALLGTKPAGEPKQ